MSFKSQTSILYAEIMQRTGKKLIALAEKEKRKDFKLAEFCVHSAIVLAQISEACIEIANENSR